MDKANSAKHITALQNMTLQFGDKVYDIFFHDQLKYLGMWSPFPVELHTVWLELKSEPPQG